MYGLARRVDVNRLPASRCNGHRRPSLAIFNWRNLSAARYAATTYNHWLSSLGALQHPVACSYRFSSRYP